METRSTVAAVAAAVAALVGATTARAISHTTDYKTNIGNYRTCTDPLLDACDYAATLSPSKYYLPSGTTTTVVHKDDGTVQLRIDAGGILTDSGISYACQDELFRCVASACEDGPREGNFCTANRCFGGGNDGAICSNPSACPGGDCTGGASCVAPTCQGGPRDNKECGTGKPACTDVADSTGWSVVFRGNYAGSTYQAPDWHFHLRGDGEDGCIKACSFSLGSTGAINSAGLSCSVTGVCGAVETFHYVELRDPDGEIVGIPTVGPALLVSDSFAVEGDPAKVGDCSRPSNAAYCP